MCILERLGRLLEPIAPVHRHSVRGAAFMSNPVVSQRARGSRIMRWSRTFCGVLVALSLVVSLDNLLPSSPVDAKRKLVSRDNVAPPSSRLIREMTRR